jgi:hypothetical protein
MLIPSFEDPIQPLPDSTSFSTAPPHIHHNVSTPITSDLVTIHIQPVDPNLFYHSHNVLPSHQLD